MGATKEKGRTAATVPPSYLARFQHRAIPHYRLSPLGSNELAARMIGERFRLSPAVARAVAELAGFGRRA